MAFSNGKIRALSLLLVAATGACDATRQQSGAEPIVRDSSGVRIVRNLAPAWSGSAEDAWSLSPEPILEIGVIEGDPAYMFSQLRGPRRLSNGSIVVLDGGTSEIRIFDADGRHVRSFGGKGQGPGEFQSGLAAVPFTQDSIAVWDVLLQRLTVFANDGSLGREFKLEASPDDRFPRADFSRRLPNGDLLASSSFARPTPLPDEPQGLPWTRSMLLRYSSEGTDPKVIVETPGIPCDPNEPRECSFIAYGPRASATFRDDRLYAGRPDRNEFRVFDEEGKLISIIHGSVPLEPVTDALRAEFIEAVVAAADASRQVERREYVRRAHFSAVVPAFSFFLLDDAGHIWAREYRVEEGDFGYAPRFPARTEGARYTVYDPDGRELGPVQLPMNFNISEIGADYVLGVGRDELDVQRVQMYALIKPSQNQP